MLHDMAGMWGNSKKLCSDLYHRHKKNNPQRISVAGCFFVGIITSRYSWGRLRLPELPTGYFARDL